MWKEGHLMLLDTKDGTVQQLTSGYSSGESQPAVSPDGQRIAFTAVHDQCDIVEIPLDGSGMQDLISTSRNEQSPSWSPNGNEILYAGERNGINGIWLTSLNEGWTRPVVTERDVDQTAKIIFDSPSLSPDRQRVAYQANASEIWVTNITGGNVVRLVSSQYLADGPSWSADENWIAFYSYSTQGLAKVRVGSGSKPETIKEGLTSYIPRWSPNGEWITCVSADGLSLISPDGKKQRFISKGTWGPHTWSADSSILYALQRQGDHVVLTSIDLKTLESKRIADLGSSKGDYFGLSLSPDGKSLASSLLNYQINIWMMEGFDQPAGFFARFRHN